MKIHFAFAFSPFLLVILALVFPVMAHDYDKDVETFVFASKTFDKGEECFTTKRTGVIVKILDTECKSAKKSAARFDKEIGNLATRLGVKRDVFKGTTITLTSHRIVYWRQNAFILAYGVTSGRRKNQVVMRWGENYGVDPYDLLAHEMGHVAWNLAGINSAFLDSIKNSPGKRAVMSRGVFKRILPKDHPVAEKLRSVESAQTKAPGQ